MYDDGEVQRPNLMFSEWDDNYESIGVKNLLRGNTFYVYNVSISIMKGVDWIIKFY